MSFAMLLPLSGLYIILVICGLSPLCGGNHDAKRLYDDLLRKNNYNKAVRPGDWLEILTVRLGLRLTQIIGVDMKNQILTTNMWVIQEWKDVNMQWNPIEYGGVTMLYVPSTSIWRPDIVLYNNADGDYTVTLMTKATLTYTGTVMWEPPAIFKSFCEINVEFFPFDEQECKLKFGTWTYDGFQVDLKHIWTEKMKLPADNVTMEFGMDLKDFYRSTEWDLMGVPAKKTSVFYPCCTFPYQDITFRMLLRRRTLFYTINLIIPCAAINLLTMLAFYLPSDSGEKISLSITILLSLSMFQLLLMELVPATSQTTPLLGKYILFTMIVVSLSVFISVMTLNVNFRSSSTHEMPAFTKKIFLQILPKLLFMRKPKDDQELDVDLDWPPLASDMEHLQNPYRNRLKQLDTESDTERLCGHYELSSNFIGVNPNMDLSNFCEACAQRKNRMIPPNVQKAIGGAVFVAKHLKGDDQSCRIKDEWKYVALVIDRIFLWIYFTTCLVGTLGILLKSPVLYDRTVPIVYQ